MTLSNYPEGVTTADIDRHFGGDDLPVEKEKIYDCLECGHELSESDLDDFCCPDCGECVVDVDNV